MPTTEELGAAGCLTLESGRAASVATGFASCAAGSSPRAFWEIGALTGLAPGETIKSARFAGDRVSSASFAHCSRMLAVEVMQCHLDSTCCLGAALLKAGAPLSCLLELTRAVPVAFPA